MDIFSYISLAGGLALFLYGMNALSSGLEKLAGGSLERSLKKLTSSPMRSLLLGLGITMAIQSSSAVTVMLVGLVNSGIMQLGQSVGIIMGSNIGTTVTAWILSLAGIESTNVFIRLLKPENFSPIFAAVGIVMAMVSRRDRPKNVGSIMVAFAILMYGMQIMSSAVAPLAESEGLAALMTAFSNPFLGVLIGMLITAVIQSSSASVGILQALALTGSVTYAVAIPIILGQNIGTCVTAFISSLGTNTNAKRVAVVHVSFNLIGTIVCLSIFYLLNAIFDFAFLSQPIGMAGIAVCHSLFNVATTGMLLPFSKQLEKLACLVVRDKSEAEQFVLLDERLLRSPSVAVGECEAHAEKMGRLAEQMLMSSIRLIEKYDRATAEEILLQEEQMDTYEDKLGTYLVKLSSAQLTRADARRVAKILHTIGDFERLGDHATNLMEAAQELHEKSLSFSDEAKGELGVLTGAIKEIVGMTIQAFIEDDDALAARVEPLEEVVDTLTAEVKTRHVERLQNGRCTINLGFVLSDILANYERASDHCSNIAICVIETKKGNLDMHAYLNSVKTGENEDFVNNYRIYTEKYFLP